MKVFVILGLTRLNSVYFSVNSSNFYLVNTRFMLTKERLALGNDTFLTKNITQDRKRFITQSKHMIFWSNIFLKADDLLLLILSKKNFSVLGVAYNDPFSVQIGSKKTIFKRFYQLFFRTAGLQHKLSILIVFPNIFHWKSAKESKLGMVFAANFGPN